MRGGATEQRGNQEYKGGTHMSSEKLDRLVNFPPYMEDSEATERLANKLTHAELQAINGTCRDYRYNELVEEMRRLRVRGQRKAWAYINEICDQADAKEHK